MSEPHLHLVVDEETWEREHHTVTALITGALCVLSFLGGVFVDPVLFVFAAVCLVMLAIVCWEAR